MNAYVAYKVSTQVCLTPLCVIFHSFPCLKAAELHVLSQASSYPNKQEA